MAEKKPRYKVLKGINYPPDNRRAEPGDIVDDIPEYGIRGFIAADAIEPVDEEKGEAKK
jgi:hypothetical protein